MHGVTGPTVDLAKLSDGIHRVDLVGTGRAFVKIRHGAAAGFFAAEARGLAALSNADAMRVPEVLEVSEDGIALEDLGTGCPAILDWERAGTGLAALHRCAGTRFGFEAPGWCGDGKQDNAWDDDGFHFFAERRLLPQGRRALDAGRIERDDMSRLDAVCKRLRELLPARPAVLVHGDLWLGNLHACANGELALIDGGAVHHGWAESDLAMLTLFGAPPGTFFKAYESAAAVDPDWRQRAPLLNLYHLLNHLNLFGGSYLGAVRTTLKHHA
ncbi:MAG: fructosamine kinase family protein [Rhodanobacteraceae bacterium]